MVRTEPTAFVRPAHRRLFFAIKGPRWPERVLLQEENLRPKPASVDLGLVVHKSGLLFPYFLRSSPPPFLKKKRSSLPPRDLSKKKKNYRPEKKESYNCTSKRRRRKKRIIDEFSRRDVLGSTHDCFFFFFPFPQRCR